MTHIHPARFKVCEICGIHGHIVFSDGSGGEYVYSKPEALVQLEQAWKDGKILDTEVDIVKRQIIDSSIYSAVRRDVLEAFLLVLSRLDIVSCGTETDIGPVDKSEMN